MFWSWHVLFSFQLTPTQLTDDIAVCGLWGDQWPVNLRAARKSTHSTKIYVLHVNPRPPPYLINDWVNHREAGDLRRHHGHYDVSVMGCVRSVLEMRYCDACSHRVSYLCIIYLLFIIRYSINLWSFVSIWRYDTTCKETRWYRLKLFVM